MYYIITILLEFILQNWPKRFRQSDAGPENGRAQTTCRPGKHQMLIEQLEFLSKRFGHANETLTFGPGQRRRSDDWMKTRMKIALVQFERVISSSI